MAYVVVKVENADVSNTVYNSGNVHLTNGMQ